jgi:DNA mismatch endonuclease (patch repair protein)
MGNESLISPPASSQAARKSMVGNKGKNTKPEVVLRQSLHSMGFRYRTFSSDVEGRPDIVIKKYKLAVFVDGCFWHGCPKCYKTPKTNTGYWKEKIRRNKTRDKKVNGILKEKGWTVLRYWEHEILDEHQSIAVTIGKHIGKKR